MENSPLQALIELARTRVDGATRRLGELLASEHACEAQLKLLVDYRAEYRERFLNAAREGMGPNAWQNYSMFLGKLDAAINAQQQVVERSRRQTAAGQQAWMHERNRKMAFDTLSQRQQQQEQRQQARSEQKLADEHAAKAYRNEQDD